MVPSRHLFVVEDANATYLLRQTGLTCGNPGPLLAKPESVGYVDIVRGFKGRQPQTAISLTPGRATLIGHREQPFATPDPVGRQQPLPASVPPQRSGEPTRATTPCSSDHECSQSDGARGQGR